MEDGVGILVEDGGEGWDAAGKNKTIEMIEMIGNSGNAPEICETMIEICEMSLKNS